QPRVEDARRQRTGPLPARHGTLWHPAPARAQDQLQARARLRRHQHPAERRPSRVQDVRAHQEARPSCRTAGGLTHALDLSTQLTRAPASGPDAAGAYVMGFPMGGGARRARVLAGLDTGAGAGVRQVAARSDPTGWWPAVMIAALFVAKDGPYS